MPAADVIDGYLMKPDSYNYRHQGKQCAISCARAPDRTEQNP
jgi:hypothetical protein